MSAPDTAVSGLSIRAFAQRDGCDEALVRRAVRNGRLTALPDGKLDPALVGTGWRKSTRRASDAADPPDADKRPADSADKPSANVSAVGPRPSAAVETDLIEEAETFIRRVLSGDFASLAEAERIKENGLALKHMLDGQRKAGSLIPLASAQAAFFEAARDNRDAWMGWVGRVAVPAAAELGVNDRLLTEVLTRHVHQHLTELGEPEFEIGDDTPEG